MNYGLFKIYYFVDFLILNSMNNNFVRIIGNHMSTSLDNIIDKCTSFIYIYI